MLNLGRRLWPRKTGRRPPSDLLLTVLRRCFCCGLFLLSLSVCFLLDFDCLFIFLRWLSAWNELTSWLSACATLLYVVLIVCVPFPFGVWGRMWNSIVSVRDYCIYIYRYFVFTKHRFQTLLVTRIKQNRKMTTKAVAASTLDLYKSPTYIFFIIIIFLYFNTVMLIFYKDSFLL